MTRFTILAALIVVSCSPLRKEFTKSDVINDHFVGFALYDPAAKTFLYESSADKYFTPASNTKILTMYSSLKYIGDSIPGLYYYETPDTLYFWGSGDPSFLNPDVYQSGKVYEFLLQTNKTLAFSDKNFYDTYFGAGWGWDDYNDYYSVEKSPLPMYGNYSVVTKDSATSAATVRPAYFSKFLFQEDPDTLKAPVIRDVASNIIRLYRSDTTYFNKILPQKTSVDLTIKLLSDTLKKTVVRSDLQIPESHRAIYSTPLDSLIAPMMIQSDNFIAEQLVLVSSGILTDSLLTENLIRKVQKNDFSDLPDPLNWVDGSGLSRYNLFTPRSVIKVWEKIYESVGLSRLKSLIANGGINGTIRNLYADEKPFVFAKTGSLRNNHSLSGLIETDKGRILLFSYMNSNYTRPSSEIKTAMDKVLRIVKEKY